MGELVPLNPPQYRRNRVLDMRGAAIVEFPPLAKHSSFARRADFHSRQASEVLARSTTLYLQAYFASIQIALCIAGLPVRHDPQHGRDTCAKENPKSPKLSPDGAA